MTGTTNRIARSASRLLILLSSALYAINAIGDSHESNIPDSSGLIDSETEVIEARWYKIDLVVFAQNTLVEDDPENWPTYPILNQSTPLIDLVYPIEEAIDENSEEIELASLIEDIETEITDDLQFIDLPKSPEELIPFATLSDEQHILTEYVEKIDKDKRTRILFHESWNHPILPDDLALPVRITGGDQFGNLNELSGWIDIHVSRYLHVETNLYLTDIIESNNPFDLVTGNSNFLTDMESVSQNDSKITEFKGIGLFSSDEFDINKKPLDPNADYLYQVAVNSAQMTEKRRLRSKELHYIDNPKFGLLMYFTPIEFAKEETEVQPIE